MDFNISQIQDGIIKTRIYKQTFWHRTGSKLLLPTACVFFAAATLYSKTAPLCVVLAIFLLFFSVIPLDYTEFAFDKNRRVYGRFMGSYRKGPTSWQVLPPLSKVIVKRFGELPVADRRSWQINNKLTSYIVLLSVAGNSAGILVHKFNEWELEQALQLGNDLATYFEIEVEEFEIER